MLKIERLEDRTNPSTDIVSFSATSVTFSGDAWSNNLVLSENSGLLSHNLLLIDHSGDYYDDTDVDPSSNIAHVAISNSVAYVNMGDGNDSLIVNNLTNFIVFVGGTGSDSLVINDANNSNGNYSITASKLIHGTGAISFTGLESLTVDLSTSAGNNVVNVQQTVPGGLMPITINGGGTNANDTVISPNVNNAWTIDTNGGGSVIGSTGSLIQFVNIDNTTGGSQSDTFLFTPTGFISGVVNGGIGTNSLNMNLVSTPITFNITSIDAGNISTGVNFVKIQNFTGGSGDDVFVIANSKGVSGNLDGGLGSNWLDYSAYLTPVTVNLSIHSATNVNSVVRFSNVVGGQNNDVITGDNSSNILIGSSGNDRLLGLDGNDILIGGLGSDALDGGNNDDILIGGITSYDNNKSSLSYINLIWTGAGTISDRIASINSSMVPLNISSVFDDGSVDRLIGGSGSDWFLYSVADIVSDYLLGTDANDGSPF